MFRRCGYGHAVPNGARFCPECWTLIVEAGPPVSRRTLIAAATVVVMMVAWWVMQPLLVRPVQRAPVVHAGRFQPAVFTIDVRDSTGLVVRQGSGFLFDRVGRAASAFHVLRGASRAIARFPDGRIYGVLHVDAWDSVADLVVFEVGRAYPDGVRHPEGIPVPEFRRTAPVVGEPVVVLGSPEGFENTLSDGLVSAVRSGEDGEWIQISAPVSPGSSGGPALDGKGRVLGVVALRSETGQNLNFAAPVESLAVLAERHDAVPLSEFASRTRRPPRGPESLADELFESGNAYLESGQYRLALERYTLAMQSDSKHVGSVYNAAICLEHLGREQEATKLFRRFLRLSHEKDEFHRHAEAWVAAHAN